MIHISNNAYCCVSFASEKAAGLGSADALANMGNRYLFESDMDKAKDFYENAAIKGSIEARHQLGLLENEGKERNLFRSIKHLKIAARAGYKPSLDCLQKVMAAGMISKDEYKEVLREHLTNVEEAASKHRVKAKAYCSHISDSELFNEEFPEKKKCPECNLILPSGQGSTYNICCGTMVCGGCNNKSSFRCISCGMIAPYDANEAVQRLQKRMGLNDAEAFNVMGLFHKNGMDVAQNYEKAIELWNAAGELGCAAAFRNIANLYLEGEGVKKNSLKAKYYFAKAAMLGDHQARHNLACAEEREGNTERSMKHFRIAAMNGVEQSLDSLREGLANGSVQSFDFDKIVDAYQKSSNETKSKERDIAASLLAKGLGSNMPLDQKSAPAPRRGQQDGAKSPRTEGKSIGCKTV